MAFVDFFSEIDAAELQQIAAQWNDARASRRMPAWNDIRPSAIAGQLKLIWVYRYDRDSDLFTGRLAGVAIETVFAKSFRGTPMSELYPDHDYERLHARAKRVVCEPALFRGEGAVFVHFERVGSGERIILPLADDGEHGDGILGATLYQPASGTPSPEAQEAEHWYDL